MLAVLQLKTLISMGLRLNGIIWSTNSWRFLRMKLTRRQKLELVTDDFLKIPFQYCGICISYYHYNSVQKSVPIPIFRTMTPTKQGFWSNLHLHHRYVSLISKLDILITIGRALCIISKFSMIKNIYRHCSNRFNPKNGLKRKHSRHFVWDFTQSLEFGKT